MLVQLFNLGFQLFLLHCGDLVHRLGRPGKSAGPQGIFYRQRFFLHTDNHHIGRILILQDDLYIQGLRLGAALRDQLIDGLQGHFPGHGPKQHCRSAGSFTVHRHIQAQPWSQRLDLVLQLLNAGPALGDLLVPSYQGAGFFQCTFPGRGHFGEFLLVNQLLPFQAGQHGLLLRSVSIQNCQRRIQKIGLLLKTLSCFQRIHLLKAVFVVGDLVHLHDPHGLDLFQNCFPVFF